MLGFAIVDRQPKAESTAVWLTCRLEGSRVNHTNAVVIAHDDDKHDEKVWNLTADRAVVLTDGTKPPIKFEHPLAIDALNGLIDETFELQQRILKAIADHAKRTKNKNLVAPVFAGARAELRPDTRDEPAYRALSAANYVRDAWEAWLEAPQPPTPVSASVRKVPPAERPVPKPPKPPRPLRRERTPTDQPCSVEGCPHTGAFRTRSKPTWCDAHIAEIQRIGGIKPLESFTRPDDWQLTECLTCTVQAHYRFVYTLGNNEAGLKTCRACFWRDWAVMARESKAGWAHDAPVPFEEAKSIAEEHGFDYLGPLTAPPLPDDPHHTRCRRCGKISAERLCDIAFGCTCG